MRTSSFVSEADRRHLFEAVAAEIYEPLQRFLRRRAQGGDADDALNETLLTVWRRLDDLPRDAVLPWSYGVARRVLANQRRAANRRSQLSARLTAHSGAGHVPDPADQPDHPRLQAALDRLPATEREVIRLWAWEQLEPREIAVALGISSNAAALRLSKAKKRLARDLGGQDRTGAGHVQDEHIEDSS